jgi:dipeptidyl aminopeptidase/acylaminoacyl peptidase
VPQLGAVQLSPNGTWVVYSVTYKDVEANSLTTEWCLQAVSEDGPGGTEVRKLRSDATAVRWHPDGKRLSMIIAPDVGDGAATGGFVLYDLVSGDYDTVKVDRDRPVGRDYVWSPNGNLIAFSTPAKVVTTSIDERQGVPFEGWNTLFVDKGHRLSILNVETSAVQQFPIEEVNVAASSGLTQGAWSPDQRSLVVATDNTPDSMATDTDLLVVDIARTEVRELVTRPGQDARAAWSPDGRWIAFFTHAGEPAYKSGKPALVSADGITLRDFTGQDIPPGRQPRWAPDSRSFVYKSALAMSNRIVRADVGSGLLTVVPMAGDAGNVPYDEDQSFSADLRRLAYLRSSVTTPPELYVVDLDTTAEPEGTPRQLTELSVNFPLGRDVQAEIIQWPSPDGEYIIHGLLLRPESSRDSDAPQPTALFFMGGPSMVRSGFGIEGLNGVLLGLLERGYVVLVPNTRGRSGYGDRLTYGIRDGKSYLRLPYLDAMAGIDKLIADNVADPDRLGVLGHSYGGGLTAYTITQTDRFKAAVVHEGGVLNLVQYYAAPPYIDLPWGVLAYRDMFGVHDSSDPAEQARLLAESSVYNTHRVTTPTLLQYGDRTLANRNPSLLYNGLRYYKVPSALFVYNEGHVFQRPAAIADDLTRTMEWLDHWVRDIPYPNAEREVQYRAYESRDFETQPTSVTQHR